MDAGGGEANRLLTAKEVAERLGVSAYTVKRWVKMGKLQGVWMGSQILRFESETVNRWVRLHRS
ncbi:MAG: helix-turn-helix domain-containing protein [Elusimicrobia bacterium]|nr:helix-turn-helix domain-containing protein [Elusimicrobiota bacterium]